MFLGTVLWTFLWTFLSWLAVRSGLSFPFSVGSSTRVSLLVVLLPVVDDDAFSVAVAVPKAGAKEFVADAFVGSDGALLAGAKMAGECEAAAVGEAVDVGTECAVGYVGEFRVTPDAVV
jgi:hypothetical protein